MTYERFRLLARHKPEGRAGGNEVRALEARREVSQALIESLRPARRGRGAERNSAALEPLAERIAAAFVFGSVAKGSDRASSDLDLLVVADGLDYSDLYSSLQAAEQELARPVNPTLMSRPEWRRKRAESDSFAARVAAQPKLFVIGGEDDLG